MLFSLQEGSIEEHLTMRQGHISVVNGVLEINNNAMLLYSAKFARRKESFFRS